jgi:4-hydroxy-tetrahydrodipicolinate synthase
VRVLPASVTPFDVSGRIDMPGVVRLLAHFKATGCDGVVLAGTNGEGPSLSAVEKRDLVRTATSVDTGLAVVLGIATSSLDEAIWLAQQSTKAGAAAALVMPPAYFREASEEGLYQWFKALAAASSLPIILYNLPQRTGVRFTPELLERLANIENVIGLKDSSGERQNLPAFSAAMPGKKLFVGDETLLLEALDAGWTGTISGAANVVPEWICEIVRAEPGEARQTKFDFLLPALTALRQGPQPALNKALLVARGVMDRPGVRLPLLSIDETQIEPARKVVGRYVKLLDDAGEQVLEGDAVAGGPAR